MKINFIYIKIQVTRGKRISEKIILKLSKEKNYTMSEGKSKNIIIIIIKYMKNFKIYP